MSEPISFLAGFLAITLSALLAEHARKTRKWRLGLLVYLAVIVPVAWVVLSLGLHWAWFVVGGVSGAVVVDLRSLEGARK